MCLVCLGFCCFGGERVVSVFQIVGKSLLQLTLKVAFFYRETVHTNWSRSTSWDGKYLYTHIDNNQF